MVLPASLFCETSGFSSMIFTSSVAFDVSVLKSDASEVSVYNSISESYCVFVVSISSTIFSSCIVGSSHGPSSCVVCTS